MVAMMAMIIMANVYTLNDEYKWSVTDYYYYHFACLCLAHLPPTHEIPSARHLIVDEVDVPRAYTMKWHADAVSDCTKTVLNLFCLQTKFPREAMADAYTARVCVQHSSFNHNHVILSLPIMLLLPSVVVVCVCARRAWCFLIINSKQILKFYCWMRARVRRCGLLIIMAFRHSPQ